MKPKGFTIIELLVTTTVMGIIFTISIPNLLQARRSAAASVELQYAAAVHKAANAYLADHLDAAALPSGADSCLNSYTIGEYGVSKAPESLSLCEVTVINGAATVRYQGISPLKTIE